MIEYNDIVEVDIINSEDENIDKIIENTENTWQPERTAGDKMRDGILGKQGEYVFQTFVNVDDNEFKYIAYDSFRNDGFKNHAPFDGLYVSKKTDTVIVDGYIKAITDLMADEKYGKLSKISNLRKEMRKNNIFIVEVKSTRLKDANMSNGTINYDKLKFHDFLNYPRFLRKTDKDDFSVQDYYSYVQNRYGVDGKKIEELELEGFADILVRVYVDQKHKKAYLMGYMTKNIFSKNKVIKKMIQRNKSESALYWAVPLYMGSSVKKLIKKLNPAINNQVKRRKFGV